MADICDLNGGDIPDMKAEPEPMEPRRFKIVLKDDTVLDIKGYLAFMPNFIGIGTRDGSLEGGVPTDELKYIVAVPEVGENNTVQ